MSSTPPDARPLIDDLLRRAHAASASDIHLEPTAAGLDIRLRIDGFLQTIETLSTETGRSAVLRLMVLAQLLTYRLDIPQEGRIHTSIGATAPPETITFVSQAMRGGFQ